MTQRTYRLLGFQRIRALLEYCAPSDLGRSLVGTLRDSDDPEEITRWMTAVTEARGLQESETPPPLDGLTDPREPLQALARPDTMADPLFCLSLAAFLQAARKLKRYLEIKTDSCLLVAGPFAGLEVPVHLVKHIRRVLDKQGTVKDSASPELKRMRRMLLRTRDDLRSRMEEEARRLSAAGTLQENVVTIRNERYVLPVKAEKQGHFEGLIHDRSASGSTTFMEPLSVVKANNNLVKLALDEQAETARCMLELSNAIRAELESIKQIIAVIGSFELTMAKASLSHMMDGVQVEVSQDGEITLLQARHPLLGSKAVPQDICLGNRRHTLIITGQNAGGKTVSLKTVGLLACMLKFGLHLPCHADSRLSVFREMHVDIGDEQNLERDLSTFSAHLEHLNYILSRPGGPECLVLLDEIGDGTDPREGAALAVSVVKTLHFKRSRTIVTSHYPELKALASSMPGMENASMGIDEKTLCPTFELQVGLPGKSYALSLARRVGLPDDVIKEAERIVPESGRMFEKVLVDLERALKEVDEHRADLEERERDLILRERDVERRERGEAGELLAEFIDYTRLKTREIQDLIGSLKRASSGRAAEQASNEPAARPRRRLGAKALKTVSKSRREAQQQARRAGAAEAAWEPRAGQWAEVPGRKIKGEIIHVGRQRLKLLVGRVEMWINRLEAKPCRPVAAPVEHTQGSDFISLDTSSSMRPELNIVGFRVEAALETVDKYIDDSVVAGLDTVRIIHGRGTYALRDAVREFLTGNPHVASIRSEDPRLGGEAVTVVDLA